MKKTFGLIAALCFPLLTWAQKDLPDNFYMKKLDNGLEILVIEDNSVPLATIELVVRNGAYTETDSYDGLSHLYEHMFFKANKEYPSQEAFMDKINEMGAIFNGTTSTNRVNYFITVNNTKVDDGLAFLNAAMRYPLFDKAEMEKENIVVDAEFERNESNPLFFLFDEMAHRMWGENYSRKNTIGNHDTIKLATPEKMNIIKNKYYFPNNTLLAVAGDVKHQEIFDKAKEIYGDWKSSDFNPFEKYPIPEFEPIKTSSTFIVENENAKTPYITMSWHGPDTRNDEKGTYVADVFSSIINQKTSAFSKNLVDSGLAFGAQLNYATDKYTGPIRLLIVPNPAKMQECLAAVEKEIAQWDSETYFTDEQLQNAKTIMAIDDAYSREKTSQFVHTVTYWWAVADIDYYTNYVANMKKVTRKDIQKYVRDYIKNKPHISGMLINPAQRSELKVDDFFK
ncbi:MAG: pitrilysin family protein [Chitinophagales bacterium]|nr:insulinase family protein [Bacteroidota bacterium]MCB9042721.1 insulinase family protein [Chitinophagales bacterium]